jgi:hypothetical protein
MAKRHDYVSFDRTLQSSGTPSHGRSLVDLLRMLVGGLLMTAGVATAEMLLDAG